MFSDLAGEFGFFGKIPALGDFVTRALPRDQIGALDTWIQQGLVALQGVSDSWLDNYLVAPVWQFVLPAGHWAATPVCGALMPSVDRVGRYFPFVTHAPLQTQPALDVAALWQRMSCLAAELPRVLHQQLEPDAVLALLHAGTPAVVASSARLLSLDSFNPAGDRSIWWSERTAHAPLREFSHRGKPDVDLFLRLFGH